jgi:hypothetical protein
MTDNLQTVQAIAAGSFIESLGVNTHTTYLNTAYANTSLVENSLAYLGIDHIRDGIPGLESPGFAGEKALAAAGYKIDFVMETPTAGAFATLDYLAKNDPGSVFSVEGPNEVGFTPVWFDGGNGVANQIADQQAIYNAVHADPALAGVSVLNLTVGLQSSISYSQLGNMSGMADQGNAHEYAPFGFSPAFDWRGILALEGSPTPGLPMAVTEAGYYTLPGSPSGVDEMVQAKYTLDLLMDAAKSGVTQMYLYELLDQMPDPTGTNRQLHYGLFHNDGTPKLAAIAIHNLTTILKDPAGTPPDSTGSLTYGVTGLPSNGSQVLFEKQNGVFAIALWAEPTIWDHTLAQEIAAPVETVTVSFARPQNLILVFDPLLGTTPIATYTNFSDVQLQITDHPLIVETGPASIDPTTLVVTEALANDTGWSSTDRITSDPTLKGTGGANAVVTLAIDGGAPVTTTADSAGNWTYTPAGLADGIHTAVASETGAAGTTGAASLTFTLDTTSPAVTSVAASGIANEMATTGQTLTITLGMSDRVKIAAPPLLLLGNGGTASYDPVHSTATTMVFNYTVGLGQATTDLTVSGIELATIGSITDRAGNDANLIGAGIGLGLGVNADPNGIPSPSRGVLALNGATEIDLFGPSKNHVMFGALSTGILKLDDPVQFTGTVVGLATGNLLDLADIAFGAGTTLGYTPNPTNTGGTLSVTDGSHTANIALLGSYAAANFVMSNDGGGHVLITDPHHP